MARRTQKNRLAVADSPLVLSGEHHIRGFNLRTNGAADATVTFYDGTAVVANEIWAGKCVSTDLAKGRTFPHEEPPIALSELRVVLSGAGSVLNLLND